MSLKYITNESERNATFMRKRNELLKELGELAVFHGAETCLIIYNPCKGEFEAWPNPMEAHRLTMRFKALAESEKNEAEMKEGEDMFKTMNTPSTMIDPNAKNGEGSSSSTPP